MSRMILYAACALFAALFPAGLAMTQDSFDFAYKWRSGQSLKYAVYIIGQVTTGKEGVKQVRIQFIDLWQVQDVDSSGFFKVLEQNKQFSGEELDLRTFGLPSKNETVTRMVDKYGRVAGVAHYTEGSRYFLLPLVLPKNPVKEGGRWKLTQEFKAPLFEREVIAKTVIVYKFEETNYNYKGKKRNCARIRIDANYRYQSEDKNAAVSGAFQGRIFFDPAEGVVVDYQITESRLETIRSENRSRSTSLQITYIGQM